MFHTSELWIVTNHNPGLQIIGILGLPASDRARAEVSQMGFTESELYPQRLGDCVLGNGGWTHGINQCEFLQWHVLCTQLDRGASGFGTMVEHPSIYRG
jgi:hypothetical protein